ncbi:MAG: GNAT family protein [Ruminococcus bromii]|nr:GNAT family protein [Ruminococcus bromii]
MKSQINFENSLLKPLNKDISNEIAHWEYEEPYEEYSFKDRPNEYLLNDSAWGREQFCLVEDGVLLGQVSCQCEGDCLWVGWSMAPQLCGKGNGAAFVERCVKELRRVKAHTGQIVLRVSARNQRAIKAYQKAGFLYLKTIKDEIAYSDHVEDFWVMYLPPMGGL